MHRIWPSNGRRGSHSTVHGAAEERQQYSDGMHELLELGATF